MRKKIDGPARFTCKGPESALVGMGPHRREERAGPGFTREYDDPVLSRPYLRNVRRRSAATADKGAGPSWVLGIRRCAA
ncbi:hypothetical protein GCM10009612_47660 [Streptomyces beijiangensis]